MQKHPWYTPWKENIITQSISLLKINQKVKIDQKKKYLVKT